MSWKGCMLCACFLVLLLAESIAIQQSAANSYVSVQEVRTEVADGWHQTYQTAQGAVTVAVAVKVPCVSQMPVVRVQGMESLDVSDDPFLLRNEVSCQTFGLRAKESKRVPSGGSFWVMEDGIAENSAIAPDETDSILTAKLLEYRAQYGEIDLVRTRQFAYSRPYGMTEDFRPDTRFPKKDCGYYEVWYAQRFYRIPWLLSESYFDAEVEGETVLPQNNTWGQVYDADDYIAYYKFVREIGVDQTDIPLLPFDRIKAAFEKVLSVGTIESVQGVELGYMIYADPQKSGEYVLIPTWVMYVRERQDKPEPGTWEEANWALCLQTTQPKAIAVDAQSGRLLDSKRTDPARLRTEYTGLERRFQKIRTGNQGALTGEFECDTVSLSKASGRRPQPYGEEPDTLRLFG